MTTTVAPLIEAKYAEDTTFSQYTSSNAVTSVDKFTGFNGSGAPVTLTVYITSPAGTAGAGTIIERKNIAAGATWGFPAITGQVIANGGALYTLASSPGSVVIRSSGRQFT